MTDRPTSAPASRLRRLSSTQLTPSETATIRRLLLDAFGPDDEERFTDHDWDHAVGGTHVILDVDGEILTHAAVVERELRLDGRPFRTGYVEAVATVPGRQGAGFGSRVMDDVNALIRDRFELGALGTGRHSFYERLGWRTWTGPSFVRTSEGLHRTPDDDGYIMVLETSLAPGLDLSAAISCDWRPGDVW